MLLLLKHFSGGPKPIRVQLCVCLAILAIQMKDWKDVLPTVVSSLGDNVESHASILDFLRVLPEEVIEGRKITLTVRSLTDNLEWGACPPRRAGISGGYRRTLKV